MRTIAGELEAVLERVLGHAVKISAAGRTDAGVHASGQVISFTTPRVFPFEKLALAANALLAQGIAIREAAAVPDSFSARFSARERTYVYAIFNHPLRSALHARYAYHVWKPIDVQALNAGAAALVGEHDFRSFCGMLPQRGPTIRCVTRLEAERRADLVRVLIAADGFLHHMVRSVVGTLVECATGRRDPQSLPAILAAKVRSAAGQTAPARGLYLAGVRYDDFDSFREPPILRSDAS